MSRTLAFAAGALIAAMSTGSLALALDAPRPSVAGPSIAQGATPLLRWCGWLRCCPSPWNPVPAWIVCPMSVGAAVPEPQLVDMAFGPAAGARS